MFWDKQKKWQNKKCKLGEKYILLDGLVCSIVEYFYESRCILESP